jgi:hypothetical protein
MQLESGAVNDLGLYKDFALVFELYVIKTTHKSSKLVARV